MRNDSKNENCNVHVMPPAISDEDIAALFNGILNVVKKKIEMETKSNMINLNLNIEHLMKKLNEKKAECNRLKNEIIFLKSKIKE